MTRIKQKYTPMRMKAPIQCATCQSVIDRPTDALDVESLKGNVIYCCDKTCYVAYLDGTLADVIEFEREPISDVAFSVATLEDTENLPNGREEDQV